MGTVLGCCLALLSLVDFSGGVDGLASFSAARGVFVFPTRVADCALLAFASSCS